IDLLYQDLSDKFFDIDKEEFVSHFDSSCENLKKIRWMASQTLLVALFCGINLKDKDYGEQIISGLSISTEKKLLLLAKHFCNEHGEDFKPSSLNSEYEKKYARKPRNIKPIIELLLKIEKTVR